MLKRHAAAEVIYILTQISVAVMAVLVTAIHAFTPDLVKKRRSFR